MGWKERWGLRQKGTCRLITFKSLISILKTKEDQGRILRAYGVHGEGGMVIFAFQDHQSGLNVRQKQKGHQSRPARSLSWRADPGQGPISGPFHHHCVGGLPPFSPASTSPLLPSCCVTGSASLQANQRLAKQYHLLGPAQGWGFPKSQGAFPRDDCNTRDGLQNWGGWERGWESGFLSLI